MTSVLTNFPNGVSSFGIPVYGTVPTNVGTYLFVGGTLANDGNDGLGTASPLATIQRAVNIALPNSVILVAPGSYAETVTIAHGAGPLTIVGLGNRGDAGIAPTTAAAKGLVNNSNDITLINLGVAGHSTATSALINTGSRLSLIGCKLEGVDTSGAALTTGPGSVAAVAAHTAGNSGDILVQDCEFAWSFNGLELKTSDYGTPTQIYVKDCRFQNVSSTCVIGTPGAFGIDSVRNLEVTNCVFDRMEDGTKPSDFVNVNGATDTGVFATNSFAIATNAAADLKVGAKVLWVANATEAGFSVARPA
jgi:hypothetical protein